MAAGLGYSFGVLVMGIRRCIATAHRLVVGVGIDAGFRESPFEPPNPLYVSLCDIGLRDMSADAEAEGTCRGRSQRWSDANPPSPPVWRALTMTSTIVRARVFGVPFRIYRIGHNAHKRANRRHFYRCTISFLFNSTETVSSESQSGGGERIYFWFRCRAFCGV